MKPNAEILSAIAVAAGKAIMTVYNGPSVEVWVKEDRSPLTLADQLSHEVIVSALKAHYPDVPILSEEGASIPYSERKNWTEFWCVDPLDGTKEFIGRNGEFTVNIALIRKRMPVFGVIYVPCQDLLYYGDADGCYKQVAGGEVVRIHTDQTSSSWTAVGSRSHADQAEQDLLKKYPVDRQVTIGSSLKFCLIAEGSAHLYNRKGPTMEWDTAAGQAIAEAAGAVMETDLHTPLCYNKESLTNGSFICHV
ncbi:3'(2'),5'-bisphosphate nucleotidase [bacterium A37T11]|nr:3'(2'),5'-bisphosphate nucleotidase [bacterium A37T11]